MNRPPFVTALEFPALSVSRRTFMLQCGGLLACATVGEASMLAVEAAPAPVRADQVASPSLESEEVIYDADPGWSGAGG